LGAHLSPFPFLLFLTVIPIRVGGERVAGYVRGVNDEVGAILGKLEARKGRRPTLTVGARRGRRWTTMVGAATSSYMD
jgi:hypothetical protein